MLLSYIAIADKFIIALGFLLVEQLQSMSFNGEYDIVFI